MQFVSVIIPVYKETPDSDETLSFNQCLKLLNYPVILFCSESLNVDYYKSVADKNGRKILFERFPDNYFENISSYNKLLLSDFFYKRFSDYKYILLYQLDALVFKDKLKYWCEFNYDFIGAPIFENWTDPQKTFKFMNGQNGGFCLRNVQSALIVLRRINMFDKIRRMCASNYLFTQIVRVLSPFYSVTNITLLNAMINYNRNEDCFWSMLAPGAFRDFIVPRPEIAMKFSFEVNPSYLYKMNDNKLPFGCHAWGVYEPEFWEPILEKISVTSQ